MPATCLLTDLAEVREDQPPRTELADVGGQEALRFPFPLERNDLHRSPVRSVSSLQPGSEPLTNGHETKVNTGTALGTQAWGAGPGDTERTQVPPWLKSQMCPNRRTQKQASPPGQ